MTPVYDLNQSAFPFEDFNEDHQHFTDHLVPQVAAAAAAATSSTHHDHQYFTFIHDQSQNQSSPESHQNLDQHKVTNTSDGSMKWMTTKVRLQIRKIVNSSKNDHRRGKSTRVVRENSEEFISTGSDIVRVCSDCNTTKTPLWRSGPHGPKTLCNACGIRQRKARRALATAAAEAATNGTNAIATSTTYNKAHNKEERSRTSYAQENNLVNTAPSTSPQDNEIKQMNKFEEFAISLSKNSGVRRVFPRDEEEAAILLMALSYGLVHG